MSISIPSLETIGQNLRRAFKAHLPGSDPYLWPSNIAATSKVIALETHASYQRLDYLQRQIFASTANTDALLRHAAEFGVTRLSATSSRGLVTFTGPASTIIVAGTEFTRTDGVKYTLLEDTEIPATGIIDAQVTSVETGYAVNLLSGADLSGAPAGVTAVVASAGLAGGADIEPIESLRARVLYRKAYPPAAGNSSDYIRWTREQAGVTRAYVSRVAYGPGTVLVMFMMDDTYADGIPQAADIARIKAALEAEAPVGATITVRAPIPKVVDIVVDGLSPGTGRVMDAIRAEVAGMLRLRGRPSLPNDGTTISRSWVAQAVADAKGEHRHRLVEPTGDVILQPYEIAVIGTVSKT